MLVSVTVSVSNRNSTYLLTNIRCSCDLDFHDESLKSLTSTLPDPKYCTSFKMNTWNSSWNIHHNRVFLMSPAAILNFSVFSKMLKVYCLSADKFELSVLKSCRLKNNNNKNYIKKNNKVNLCHSQIICMQLVEEHSATVVSAHWTTVDWSCL